MSEINSHPYHKCIQATGLGAPGNGMPGWKPYVYRGGDDGRAIEVEARISWARAELAARIARQREAHWIRDIPASCTCRWEERTSPLRYELAQIVDGCPWHTGGAS